MWIPQRLARRSAGVVDGQCLGFADDDRIRSAQVGDDVVRAGLVGHGAVLGELFGDVAQDAVLAPVHVLRFVVGGRSGAGVAVPASAAGIAVYPMAFEPAAAATADQ
jgi:hypothetical protein